MSTLETIEAHAFEREMVGEYQEAAERSDKLSANQAEVILAKSRIISYNQIPVQSRENIFQALVGYQAQTYLAIAKEYDPEELNDPEIDAPYYPRERAAYLLARAVGFDDLVIPTISRIIENQPRPFSIWKTSPVLGRIANSYGKLKQIFESQCDENQLWQLMILNYSTGNTDGHDRNLKLRPDGQLWSYDYSLAFSKYRRFTLHPHDPIAVLDKLNRPIPVGIHKQLVQFASSPKYWELNYQLDEMLPANDVNGFRERFFTVVSRGVMLSELVDDQSAKFAREMYQKEGRA